MNVAIIILNVFIIHSPASTVYDKPVCYLNNLIKKNCWDALIWVTGHYNRAAVSRNRYGVEKTVDTHKILINAIKFYVCLHEI
jgi:hypothetical protein